LGENPSQPQKFACSYIYDEYISQLGICTLNTQQARQTHSLKDYAWYKVNAIACFHNPIDANYDTTTVNYV